MKVRRQEPQRAAGVGLSSLECVAKLAPLLLREPELGPRRLHQELSRPAQLGPLRVGVGRHRREDRLCKLQGGVAKAERRLERLKLIFLALGRLAIPKLKGKRKRSDQPSCSSSSSSSSSSSPSSSSSSSSSQNVEVKNEEHQRFTSADLSALVDTLYEDVRKAGGARTHNCSTVSLQLLLWIQSGSQHSELELNQQDTYSTTFSLTDTIDEQSGQVEGQMLRVDASTKTGRAVRGMLPVQDDLWEEEEAGKDAGLIQRTLVHRGSISCIADDDNDKYTIVFKSAKSVDDLQDQLKKAAGPGHDSFGLISMPAAATSTTSEQGVVGHTIAFAHLADDASTFFLDGKLGSREARTADVVRFQKHLNEIYAKEPYECQTSPFFFCICQGRGSETMSARESQDLGMCMRCREGHSEAPNELMICLRCEVACHVECAGLATVPRGDWYCSECRKMKVESGSA